MPRARREQDYLPRSKTSRGGSLRTTPPRLQDGTSNTSTLPSQLDSVNPTTTAIEPATSLIPVQAGLATGLQEITSLVNKTSDGSDFTNPTLQNSTISAVDQNRTRSPFSALVRNNENTNTSLTDNLEIQSTDSFSDTTSMSSLVNSVAFERDGDQSTLVNSTSSKIHGLSALLAQWAKKNDGIHVAEVSTSAPSWMQNYEKYGLAKAAAAIQVLSGESNAPVSGFSIGATAGCPRRL